jgi:hypothetical protein
MRTIGAYTTIAAAVLACVTVMVPRVSISQLITHPGSYDRQNVAVTGKVEQIELKTSQAGSDYEVFKLCDKACVSVYAWGRPLLKEGQAKSVRGTFVAVRHDGTNTVHNEIVADHDSL